MAANARRTLARLALRVRPRCRGARPVRRSAGATGSSQSAASSTASDFAVLTPRQAVRSGSPGTNTTARAGGLSTTSATSRAASRPMRRRPRSFQARTRSRAGPSYSTAARAVRNGSRRPAHSTHRSTGHAVGAPQRPQRGGRRRRRATRHSAQRSASPEPQAPQRVGTNRSSKTDVMDCNWLRVGGRGAPESSLRHGFATAGECLTRGSRAAVCADRGSRSRRGRTPRRSGPPRMPALARARRSAVLRRPDRPRPPSRRVR